MPKAKAKPTPAKAKAKAAPKAKAVAKKEAAPKREPMPEQNGVKRPRPGGKCARVWEIADDLSKKLKRPAAVSEVLETASTDKQFAHNPANVKTEYARWRKFNGITGRVTAPKA